MADNATEDFISVPVVRLDDELKDAGSVSLLKMECEGYELAILDGCWHTIQAQRPILSIEVHPTMLGTFGHTVKDLCDLLRSHYDLQF